MASSDSIAPAGTPETPSVESSGLNITHEVAVMQRLPMRELKQKFVEVFGEQPRSGNRQWLVKRIAWRMQANIEGDLPERARKRALEIANDADLRVTPPRVPKASSSAQATTVKVPVAAFDNRLPLPGTHLTREYKGRLIEVTVLAEGFLFEGERYKSLSAIAKAVTGSHWNGFYFFDLEKNGRAD